ncbi:hypothetical protein [Chondromyces apiculatus]|uniref:Uncharacterized protein n=1 Tax=Chondromyces apiculatus DSM 436 TaxID=1192034 RepID=A0A017T3H5_9BACT|nr:hypothetical protein [Chondromyces apiculatus]EYF03798.1 Hypothetical protein CAP_5228 [Chondromyces apiculatus DSM 436]
MTSPRRRDLLAGAAYGALATALALLAPACTGAAPAHPPPRPVAPPLPPLATTDLTRLLPLAGLRWLLLLKPREIAAVPWLIPWIGVIAPEQNLDRFAAATGVDLRQLPEVVIASYPDALVYLARHTGDPATVERLFRARLTGNVRRAAERPDLVRLSGDLGTARRTLVLLGADAAGLQDGGSTTRGPARIATLYALGKLRRSPTVLTEEPLRSLAARLDPAPLRALAPGPFEGELARGARGLLAGATALGVTARPGTQEKILVEIVITGDFTTSAPEAREALLAAWNELGLTPLGQLLGLDTPDAPPVASHAPDAVALSIALDPALLARGLKALTSAEVEEIMR